MLQTRSFRRGRLSEQVVDELERMMMAEFPSPGDRWPKEAELADRFRVSRIVVREAVKILEDRGVLEVTAGRGTFTCRPSLDRVKTSLLRLFRDRPIPDPGEMERMLELREALEETVVALAAVRAESADFEAIEAALKEMDARGADAGEIIQADLRFHLAVARAAHNPFFEMVLEPLTHVFLTQIALTDTLRIGVAEHRSIYKQIREGNPVGARQAVRRLMQFTRSDVRRALGVLKSSRSGANGRRRVGGLSNEKAG